jgi:hypothetical protein
MRVKNPPTYTVPSGATAIAFGGASNASARVVAQLTMILLTFALSTVPEALAMLHI